jgi:hypothetical protein
VSERRRLELSALTGANHTAVPLQDDDNQMKKPRTVASAITIRESTISLTLAEGLTEPNDQRKSMRRAHCRRNEKPRPLSRCGQG